MRMALAGESDLAFVPLVWQRLPVFVRAAAGVEFWRDVAAVARWLGEAAMVCEADAVEVPMLPGLLSSADSAATEKAPSQLADLPEVRSMAGVVARISAVGRTGVVVGVPGLEELSGALPWAAEEDLEDALRDLVRAGVEAGAEAVVVRGAAGAGVERSVGAVAPLAAYYGAKVFGTDGVDCWRSEGAPSVGLLGRDGHWASLDSGVILTAGDVSDWWTADEMRANLR